MYIEYILIVNELFVGKIIWNNGNEGYSTFHKAPEPEPHQKI